MNKLDMVVIHDLKNTLLNVALRLEKRDDVVQERTAILSASSKLTNLLLLNKYDNNEFDIQLDSDSPSELMDELANNFRVMYPSIEIEVDYTHAPLIWFYDRYYVELAINSGLHNAGEYAKSKVKLTATKENERLVFMVADDGEGYSDAVIKSFENDVPLSASQKGTGLGIMLANTIANKHINKGIHGAVKIKNTGSGGAEFSINLP